MDPEEQARLQQMIEAVRAQNTVGAQIQAAENQMPARGHSTPVGVSASLTPRGAAAGRGLRGLAEQAQRALAEQAQRAPYIAAEQDRGMQQAARAVAPSAVAVFLGGSAPVAPQPPATQAPTGSPVAGLSGQGVAPAITLIDAELARRNAGRGGPLVTSTRTATTHAPVSQETQAALGQDASDLTQALTDRSHVLGASAGDQAGAMEGATGASEAEAARQKQEGDAVRQQMDQRVGQAQAINQRVLDGAIDPNRVLGDSMSGGRIAAAIGLLFAGMAQGQSGADAFLANINHTIDRDIAAQQSNMENTRAAGAAQQNLVGMYRETLGDQGAATRAARATMLQSVAQRLEAMQSRMGQNMQPPELALLLAQLRQSADQASAEAQAGAWTNTQTSRARTGGGGGGLTEAQRIQLIGMRGNLMNTATNADATNLVRYQAEQRQGRPDAEPPVTSMDMTRYATRRAVSNSNRSLLARIQARIDAAGPDGDISGVGVVDSRRSGLLSDFAGREMQADIRAIRARYLSETTGAVSTEAERAAAEAITEGTTEQDFRARIANLKAVSDSADRDIDAAAGPNVVNLYRQRGGSGGAPSGGPQPVD